MVGTVVYRPDAIWPGFLSSLRVVGPTQQPARSAVSVDLREALTELLGHERHYWRGRAEELDRGSPGNHAARLAGI
jgi:hypothetical protein